MRRPDDPPRALVRRPSERLGEGIVTHIDRRPVDPELARAQWDGYVRALGAAGWKVIEVPPDDASPDSAFVEDTMVVYGELAVIARPGAASRRRELEGAAHAIAGLGFRVAEIAAPGTLDGGDVLRVGETVYVGTGGRTNLAGLDQLRALLEPLGARVKGVPIAGVLHLKTALGALPDGTLVGSGLFLAGPVRLPRIRAAHEPSGAQVLVLGERRLLVAGDCPRSAARYARDGYDPVVVEIGEFQKLEGAVTCLSVLADQRLT